MHDPRFEPLPEDKSKHPERFVRDFVQSVHDSHWTNEIEIQGMRGWGMNPTSSNDQNLKEYLQLVWGNNPPFEVLEDLGYIERHESRGDNKAIYRLTAKALDKKLGPSIASIFISYKRDQSTAFALLIIEHLKKHSISAFLDMHPDRNVSENKLGLTAGDEWEKELQEKIQECDCVLVLITPETLSSQPVQNEILWARNAHKRMIPIWHNGFNGKQIPSNLPVEIKHFLKEKTGIPVAIENPDQYNVAIKNLLRDLGVNS